MKSKLAKSINISSNSTIPFAAALTNSTELAKAKGHLNNSYPVSFRDNPFRPANTTHKAEKYYQDKPAGVPFVSAEDAYQHFQVGLDNDQKFALMVEILEAKLTQYPQLTEIITKNGGAAWLNQCSHVVNNPDSFWEGMGLNSGFITALITAYRKIANDTSSLYIVKSDPKEITEEPQDDSIIILDKYVSYEPTSLSLRISFNNQTKAQQWGRYLQRFASK